MRNEPSSRSCYRLLQGGKARVRRLNRARILLLADEGATDENIAGALHLGIETPAMRPRDFVSIVLIGPALLAPGPTPLTAPALAQVGFGVEELWRTTGQDVPGGPIGAVAGIGSLPDGTIWVSDPLGRRVVAIGPDGRGLHAVARSGDGPGEVRSPTLITRSDDRIALYDLARGSIELFSASSGAFVERVQLATRVTWPKGFVFSPGKGFILTGGIPGNRYSVHHFNERGDHVASWEAAPRTRDWQAALVVAGGPLTRLRDGRVLLSQATPHLLRSYQPQAGQGYDPDGTVLASDPRLLQPVLDDAIEVSYREDGVRAQTFREYSRSAGVFELSSGGILNVVVLPADNRTLLQHYDPYGSLIAQQFVRGALTPWALTHEDDLLVTNIHPDTGEWSVVRLRLFRSLPDA